MTSEKKTIWATLAVLSLIVGLALFFFTNGPIRWYGGDMIVILFLYSLAALVFPKPATRLAIILLISFGIETAQLFFSRGDPLRDLVLGSTFDVIDLLIYTMIALTIFTIDLGKQKKRDNLAPSAKLPSQLPNP